MKIDQIEIFQSPVKLKEPFTISLGALDHALNIIVKIRTNSGLTGFGECSPFMTINGESMDTCFITGQYIAKMLIQENPLDIRSCISTMDSVIYGNWSIKSAFDIALHDITSQYYNQPLYQYLGGKNSKTLITDYTVSLGNCAKMAEDAQKIKDEGFKFIKVKLGNQGEKDVQRIQEIRKKIGLEIPIRIDANQGWSVDEAITTLNQLEPFNIQFCEEPTKRNDYTGMAKIKNESPFAIMADESCTTFLDASHLIYFNSCEMFNIKIGKSGGIYKSKEIIDYALKNGLRLQVGGFLESRLGFTASAHLALTSNNIEFCDFDTPLMFSEDPVTDGIIYNEKGIISMPEKPGLGASVDEKYLEKLQKVIIKP